VTYMEWPSRRRRIVCVCCGRQGKPVTKGLRASCWQRWVVAGCPDGGPPPPPTREEIGRRGGLVRRDDREANIEDYLILRSRGMRRGEIAAALGVSIRTTERYWQAAKQTGAAQ
jgi:hypothetical protein